MAGALLAKELYAQAEITLVDPNDYFEVPMAAPRSLVQPEFASQSLIPFDQALPGVKHVQGKLVELSEKRGIVHLNSGSRINVFGDVMVVATGSRFSNPLMRSIGATLQERKQFYVSYQQRISGASRILIVGGGPIGIEVAGEISDVYPDKAITIIEAGPRILAGTSDAASKAAARELTQRGVTIITDERLVDAGATPKEAFSSPDTGITSNNRRIPYDLLIWCTGGKPNTEYMRARLSTRLNQKGQIRVTSKLRIEGMQRIFALGDITDLDENKMAWHIESQVKNAAHNIRKVLAGKSDDESLKTHHPQTDNPKMAITLGSKKGVLNLPLVGVITSPMMNRAAKAGHMLVPKYRKKLGV